MAGMDFLKMLSPILMAKEAGLKPEHLSPIMMLGGLGGGGEGNPFAGLLGAMGGGGLPLGGLAGMPKDFPLLGGLAAQTTAPLSPAQQASLTQFAPGQNLRDRLQ